MALAESSDPLRDLALVVDAIARRVRPWQIGHELAKDLTADGRSMTPDEVAVVQALERTLDWSGEGDGRHFRPWWLDEDTSLEETHDSWPAVWESVAEAGEHPTVVAHLSDLLWIARHGTPHLHAQRAVDAYLASADVLDEWHDRCRSLMRAHELAGAIRDRDRLTVTEARICDATDAALTASELGVALALLDHLLSRRLGDDAATRAAELLERTWRTASRTDHVERLAKLLLRRVEDDSKRLEVNGRVVAVFRDRAEQEEGFGRLIALREALRVAEELGHPSHGEILHEIETLDSESAFTAVRTEQVLSRQHIAAYCVELVGADSLERALARFASQLPITPTSVQRMRDNTLVRLWHVVTNFRIGEANSVVTSTETANADQDPILAAVERDVLQRVGYQAQMTAFLFLVPALHQTLASYEPWTVADVHALLEPGPADVVVADALARSLEHFHHRRYDEAVHVALPRVERLIRHIARSCGVATTKRPTKRVGGVRGLGEILFDLRGDGNPPILPEPLLTAAELTLVDPDSLNLRNEFLHGISDEARAAEAALVLQLGLALSLAIRLGPEESGVAP
ncbi:MAG: DUF4209 domain-containing protein [Actinomycetota bacterium]|nr:DUF4209 domain-containing protein [Actinomycetota bacterium]